MYVPSTQHHQSVHCNYRSLWQKYTAFAGRIIVVSFRFQEISSGISYDISCFQPYSNGLLSMDRHTTPHYWRHCYDITIYWILYGESRILGFIQNSVDLTVVKISRLPGLHVFTGFYHVRGYETDI
jgi:hypothetical protein